MVACKQERAALEQQWQARLRAAEAEAAEVKRATEAKVAAVAAKLQQLAAKEAEREQQRGVPCRSWPCVQTCCLCALASDVLLHSGFNLGLLASTVASLVAFPAVPSALSFRCCTIDKQEEARLFNRKR